MNAALAALAISHIDLLSTKKKEVVFFFRTVGKQTYQKTNLFKCEEFIGCNLQGTATSRWCGGPNTSNGSCYFC